MASAPHRMEQSALKSIFTSLKPKQSISVWFDSAFKSADSWTELQVGRKSKSKKYNLEKISLITPQGSKFYLYNRQGKISLAMGDMATVLIAIKTNGKKAESFSAEEPKLWGDVVKGSGWNENNSPCKYCWINWSSGFFHGDMPFLASDDDEEVCIHGIAALNPDGSLSKVLSWSPFLQEGTLSAESFSAESGFKCKFCGSTAQYRDTWDDDYCTLACSKDIKVCGKSDGNWQDGKYGDFCNIKYESRTPTGDNKQYINIDCPNCEFGEDGWGMTMAQEMEEGYRAEAFNADENYTVRMEGLETLLAAEGQEEDWKGMKFDERFPLDGGGDSGKEEWRGWSYEDGDIRVGVDGSNGNITTDGKRELTIEEAKAFLNSKGIPFDNSTDCSNSSCIHEGDWDLVYFNYPNHEKCYKHDWGTPITIKGEGNKCGEVIQKCNFPSCEETKFVVSKIHEWGDFYIKDYDYGDGEFYSTQMSQECEHCGKERRGHGGGKVMWDFEAESFAADSSELCVICRKERGEDDNWVEGWRLGYMKSKEKEYCGKCVEDILNQRENMRDMGWDWDSIERRENDYGYFAESFSADTQTRVYRNLGIGAALVAGLAYWFKR